MTRQGHAPADAERQRGEKPETAACPGAADTDACARTCPGDVAGMGTPVCDFVNRYVQSGAVRLHMPGHKGQGGMARDITEIPGADVLYAAGGILRESEDNASRLFGCPTFYSCEGSSLCIRAMLALAAFRARRKGVPLRLLAGRNAHRVFASGAALAGFDVDWLTPPSPDVLSCPVSPDGLAGRLQRERYAAVYLTSPDYLGQMADLPALAAVCRSAGVPLLVDNAHGAYLRFLPHSLHPIDLGADLCCDSAHKTLPVLTGGAYLHIAPAAAADFLSEAERALGLFASTSPSYLLLQSLDNVNPYLQSAFPAALRVCVERVSALRQAAQEAGIPTLGDEPAKLTLAPKAYGYTGEELATVFAGAGVVCEFADPDYLVLMFSPANDEGDYARVRDVLRALPRKAVIRTLPPPLPLAKQTLPLREAMLAPSVLLDAADCVGRVLADPCVSCPPAVPILLSGETVTPEAVALFRYYGIQKLRVVDLKGEV